MHLHGNHLPALALVTLLLSVVPSIAELSINDNPNKALIIPPLNKSSISLTDDFKTLLEKAEKGDADAEQQVGTAYYNGTGVAQDYQQALIWLQKAADQNNTRALSWLGLVYTNGCGVPQDQAKAFQYFLRAATEGNDANDKILVAERYAQGTGVNPSDVESLSWYIKAAAQGNAEAQLQAGLDYFNGRGATKDPQKAFGYFLQASYHNDDEAQYYLACFYWNGIFVTRDPVQAYKWIQLASRRYHEKEAATLSEEIASSLTPAQLAQGDALVDDWPREIRSQGASGAAHATFTTGDRATIPFEIVRGEIVMTATINGSDKVKLLFDTGSPTTLIDAICVSEYKIARGSTYRTLSGIGKQTVLGSRTDDLSLSLPGITFDHISLDISSSLGRADGILGWDVMSNYVIQIDYVAKTVTFISPQSFNPANAGQLLPCTLSHTKIFVKAKLNNNHFESNDEDFVLDTGCSEGFILAQHYTLSYPLLAFAKGWEGEAEGVGGTIWMERVPCFGGQIGDIPLKNPIVTVVKRDQGVFTHVNGLIGNEIWKNFDLTIDYPDQKLYLKPNSKYEAPPVAPPPITAAAKPSGPD